MTKLALFRATGGQGVVDGALFFLLGVFPGSRWISRAIARRTRQELVEAGAWQRTASRLVPHVVLTGRRGWVYFCTLGCCSPIELDAHELALVGAYEKGLPLDQAQRDRLAVLGTRLPPF